MMMSLALAKKNMYKTRLLMNAHSKQEVSIEKNRLYFSFIIRRCKYYNK